MKRFLIALSIILFPFLVNAQIDSSYRTKFYEQRLSFFEAMPNTPNEIIMLGNSITNGVSWSELFQNINIKNRGISGDNTFGVLARLDEITASKPKKVFLLIGINDLANNTPVDVIARNYEKIIVTLQQQSPDTRIYLQTLFPTNNEFPQFPKAQNKEKQIRQLNQIILQLANRYRTGYIDLHPLLRDNKGKLDKRYTNDGLHLLGNAYTIWANVLEPYIYDNLIVEEPSPKGVDTSFNNRYYQTLRELHEAIPVKQGTVVMLGNSITEQGHWAELLGASNVRNRGIGGDISLGMLNRLPRILQENPKQLFIMAGINDLFRGLSVDMIVSNCKRMLALVKKTSPKTIVYLQSVLPVNNILLNESYPGTRMPLPIKELNERLKELAITENVIYIDVYAVLIDSDNQLKPEFTTDGLHLTGKAYLVWADRLKQIAKIK